jgi:hypothetical protein
MKCLNMKKKYKYCKRSWNMDNDQVKKMKKILTSFGIQLTVSACGCCDSPYIRFEYEDFVYEEDGRNFDNVNIEGG